MYETEFRHLQQLIAEQIATANNTHANENVRRKKALMRSLSPFDKNSTYIMHGRPLVYAIEIAIFHRCHNLRGSDGARLHHAPKNANKVTSFSGARSSFVRSFVRSFENASTHYGTHSEHVVDIPIDFVRCPAGRSMCV